MAKRIVTTTETDEDDKEKDKELLEDEDVLRALIEIEGTDEIRWQIYRVSQPDPGFLQTLNTAELSMDRMAEFGPGRYKVRGIKQDGSYYKGRTLTISKRPQANPNQLVNEALEKFKGKDADTLSIMTLLMNQQQESNRSMTQVLVAALGKERGTEFPWGALVAALPPSLIALKEFFANKADPMKQMLDAIAVTEKLRGEGDGKGTSWPDLIKEGLATIPATLQSLRQPSGPESVTAHVVPQTPGAVPPPVHTPEAVPAPAPTILPATEATMNMQLLPWLRDMLSKLLRAANRNSNASLYAELFLEELPDAITDAQIMELLGAEDWWSKLTFFESRVTPYQGWFVDFRAHLLLLLNEAPDERESPDTANDTGTLQPAADSHEADEG